MPKQTSIEWLVEQLPLIQQEGLRDDIQQAKQMHKEEIIDSWKDAEGYNDENAVILAKQYYNETYGGQDE